MNFAANHFENTVVTKCMLPYQFPNGE